MTGAPGYAQLHIDSATGVNERTREPIPATIEQTLPVGSHFDFTAQYHSVADMVGGQTHGADLGQIVNLAMSAVEINCDVLVDGQVVSHSRSNGAGATAGCRGEVPDGDRGAAPSADRVAPAAPGCTIATVGHFHLRSTEIAASTGVLYAAGTQIQILGTGHLTRGNNQMYQVRVLADGATGFIFLGPEETSACP